MEKKRLIIAIPASVISDTPHPREKTSKIGLIARAAAIFRVDEIIIYQDDPKVNQDKELKLITKLLSYIETPQYLRKRLFKIEPHLQFAGILPPLRTPHHPASAKTQDLEIGEYREGIILSQVKEGLQVDIGAGTPVLLREKQHAIGERLTLQIIKTEKQVEVQTVNRADVPYYWGYVISIARSLKQAIGKAKADLKLGTSKKGEEFTSYLDKIMEKLGSISSILIVFGSPARGIYEIAADENISLKSQLDFILNVVPCQGTETVRTEEAVLATLAVL
ncbi:MAG TPA: RNA methyltransferase, partial [Candidatus Sulfotelmatobacter sp.]|nr:RNA methyltransferase [Candidatus Sulfotelmatobacter sp.]